MNTQQVERYLRNAMAGQGDVVVDSCVHDRVVHARMTAEGAPDVWAEVSTPCAPGFRLAVPGGFLLMKLTDDTPPDDEVRQVLDECVDAARACLEQQPRPVGRFFPTIAVSTLRGEEILQRTVVDNARNLLRAMSGRSSVAKAVKNEGS